MERGARGDLTQRSVASERTSERSDVYAGGG